MKKKLFALLMVLATLCLLAFTSASTSVASGSASPNASQASTCSGTTSPGGARSVSTAPWAGLVNYRNAKDPCKRNAAPAINEGIESTFTVPTVNRNTCLPSDPDETDTGLLIWVGTGGSGRNYDTEYPFVQHGIGIYFVHGVAAPQYTAFIENWYPGGPRPAPFINNNAVTNFSPSIHAGDSITLREVWNKTHDTVWQEFINNTQNVKTVSKLTNYSNYWSQNSSTEAVVEGNHKILPDYGSVTFTNTGQLNVFSSGTDADGVPSVSQNSYMKPADVAGYENTQGGSTVVQSTDDSYGSANSFKVNWKGCNSNGPFPY